VKKVQTAVPIEVARGYNLDTPAVGAIMSQTADAQIRPTLDALAERLRSSIADQVSVASEQLLNTVEAAKRAAVDDAVRAASVAAERDVTARLNEVFARREDQIKEASRAEWFAVGQEQGRKEAALAAAARDAEAKAAADAAEKTAASLAARLDAAEKSVAAMTARLDASEKAAAAMTARLAAAENTSAAHAARIDTVVVAHREETTRLLDAVRRIDEATSLSQTLDALGVAAKAEVGRFAVLLPKGDVLRSWSQAGFPALEAITSREIPLPDAGIAADTIQTGRPSQVERGRPGRPAFASPAEGNAGSAFVAVPVTMNGQVVAVLCGDDAKGEGGTERVLAVFEMLARHAGRVLETLTAMRLAQLGSQVSQVVAAFRPQ